MPNFNENNIGFTKFCQENLKSHENMLQKYLCPMAFCTGPYCLVPQRRSFVSDTCRMRNTKAKI